MGRNATRVGERTTSSRMRFFSRVAPLTFRETCPECRAFIISIHDRVSLESSALERLPTHFFLAAARFFLGFSTSASA